jgi:hypothetical protein
MFLKSLLAASFVSLVAIVWQLGSTQATAACRQEPQVDSADCTPPSWIEDPSSFFAEAQPGVVVGVGRARISANPRIARLMATSMARSELIKAQGKSGVEVQVVHESTRPGGVHTTLTKVMNRTTSTTTAVEGQEKFNRTELRGSVANSKTLASWTSPEGIFWILLAADA